MDSAREREDVFVAFLLSLFSGLSSASFPFNVSASSLSELAPLRSAPIE
jgi:hypothetical protein